MTALERNVPVLPVLVERADIPAAADLPAELSPLSRINALEVTDNRWDYDVGRLIESIEALGVKRRPAVAAAPAGSKPDPAPRPARRRPPLVPLLVGLPVVVIAAVLFATRGGESPGPPEGGAAEPSNPLVVDVRTNLDDFDRTGIAHVPEFYTSRPVAELGPLSNVQLERVVNVTADTNERGRWAWARQVGAVDAGETLVRVTIQGREDAPVILQGVDVQVVERRPAPTAGSILTYAGIGSAVTADTLTVDLDRQPPAVAYVDESRNERTSFTFSVSRTDFKVLDILAAPRTVTAPGSPGSSTPTPVGPGR